MSIYNCMQDLVGVSVETCGATTPKRYYLNSLSGISLNAASKAANQEQSTGLGLIRQKIELAMDELAADVLASVGVTVSGKALLTNKYVGYLNQGAKAESASNGAKGVIIRVNTLDYVELQISKLAFWSGATYESMKFKIVNLLTGEVLHEITQAVQEGVNEIICNITVSRTAQDLYVGVIYESDGILTFTNRFNATDCCPSTLFHCGNGVSVESATWANAEEVKYGSRQNSIGAHGLAVWYSLVCSPESFICQNSQLFGYALLYKAGSLIMQEVLHSTRLNGTTAIAKESASELMGQYHEKYVALLTSAMSGISNNTSLCFSCKGKVYVRTMIP